MPLSLLILSVLALPAPTGPYPVGTTPRFFVDETRPSPVKGRTGREIVAQIWYPGARAGATAIPYVPVTLAEAMAGAEYYGQKSELLKSWGNTRSHAFAEAPPRQGTHPVVLFEPGLGVSLFNYTLYFEDLASNGYIVVALEPPAGCFSILPTGELLTTDGDPEWEDPANLPRKTTDWAKDFSFVLDQLARDELKSMFDFDRVGVFGHSMGGAASMVVLSSDNRFKAAVNLDGVMDQTLVKSGSKVPALRIGANPNYNDADLAKLGRTREQWDQMRARGRIDTANLPPAQSQPIFMLAIRDTGHFSFTDAPYTMPSTITQFSDHPLPADKTLAKVTSILKSFFDLALNGKTFSDFKQTVAKDEEVELTQVR